MKKIISIMLSIIFLTSSQMVFAETYQDKVDFASSLEETLGHFWALEQNLDDDNIEFVIIHATHPIAELYDSMKPTLKATDPALDGIVEEMLVELKDKTANVSREQAQQALDDARDIIAMTRTIVIGDELSNDPMFKAALMIILLETAVAEYGEAVRDGEIVELAEFQDGSAFVWRSQQILDTIKSDIGMEKSVEFDANYDRLWDAFDSKADISIVEASAGQIITELQMMTGDEDMDLLDYVANIQDLLMETKQAYSDGDKDLALSLATKAYLDNYEFLEGPLIELGEDELMVEVEHMLREDLRNMIKDDAPPARVNAHIDAVLEKMDSIAVIVPEFGTIVMLILVVAISSIIVISAKSRFGSGMLIKS